MGGGVLWTTIGGTKLRGSMKWDGRSDDTCDSGMGTLRSHGIGPAMESWMPDTDIDGGIVV